MAQLGWIHFSRTFKDRVNTFLDMMEEEGMIDELGVGVFRDAFADLFFPGISTIQTRAKYFFIVPYLIKDYFNLSSRQQTDLGKFLYDKEHEIMWMLAAKYGFNRRAGSGVIGVTKRKPNKIGTRPSSIYFNGLRTMGFIKTNLRLSEYTLRINESLEEKLERTLLDKNESGDDSDVELSAGHNIKVSTYQPNWKDNLDLPLSYEEADFFVKQVGKSISDSLFGQIVSNDSLRKIFLKNNDFDAFARYAMLEKLDESLKKQIALAHDLNEVVKGLHWVYSNEINKLYYDDDRYYDNWKNWKSELYGNLIALDNLKIENLLLIAPRTGYYSKVFMEKILDMVQSKSLNYKEMVELVKQQEQKIKTAKSRFKNGAEKDFTKGETKSLSFLNYRYNNVKTIIKDIYNGLKQ